MSSTSPLWDSRNRGFIPPSELQQLRRSSVPPPVNHDFHSQDKPQPNRPPSMAQQPPPPPAKPTTHAHARSSSFFGFLKPGNDHSNQPAQHSLTMGPQRTGTQPSDEHGHISISERQPPRLPPQQSLSSPPQERRSSTIAGPPQPPQLHPEIRSVVQLTMAHAHKVYFSGPLVRRIERLPDGHRPAKEEGWRDVWAQLGGTTLSVWDMKEIEDANKQGKEAPPTYINITDAFVQVLGSVTIPATPTSPAQKYANVVTVNSAGSNLLLFSCPSTAALISWAAALRLSAWEKSRLEEIYTAHLIRITLNDGRDEPSPLIRGRMEGWVRLRVAGQTDWKRLWMVVASSSTEVPGSPPQPEHRPNSPNAPRKRRISSLFGSRDEGSLDIASPASPVISFYQSQKGKDRKKAMLSLQNMTQAFAVYPERPELINRSTLIKVEGLIGDEEVAGGMRGREGWVLIMPEFEPGNPQTKEMLRWLMAVHDAFRLYGRPKQYSWDPRDPASLMFAYPVGPNRDLLFLDREMAESMDPRDDRTSAVRSRLLNTLLDRMQGKPSHAPRASSSPPTLPPIPSARSEEEHEDEASGSRLAPMPQLPALSFDAQAQDSKRILTPISESEGNGHSRPMTSQQQGRQDSGSNEVMLDKAVHGSPTMMSASETFGPVRRSSEASSQNVNTSRPDSKLSHSFVGSGPKSKTPTDDSHGHHVEPVNITLPVSPAPTSPSVGSRSFTTSPPPMSPHSRSGGMAIVPPRTPSPAGFSILTSPHSAIDSPKHGSFMALYEGSERGARPEVSVMSTPKSASSSLPLTPSKLSQPPTSVPNPSTSGDSSSNLYEEAGALYYMQQFDQETSSQVPLRRVPPIDEDEDEDEDAESSSEYGPTPALTSPLSSGSNPVSPPRTGANSPARHGIASRNLARTTLPTADAGAPLKVVTPIGRRPSGARAPPSGRRVVSDQNPERRDSPRTSMDDESDLAYNRATSLNSQMDDPNADALAALSFLEQEDKPAPSRLPAKQTSQSSSSQAASPPPIDGSAPPIIVEPEDQGRSSTPGSDAASQYRSSFAPSKTAMQRKAKTEAQQAAQEAAAHRPGRVNGKLRAKTGNTGAWGDSSEEEEDEDEDEDEDVDSDGGTPASARGMDDRSASGQPVDNLSLHSQARGPSPGGPLADSSYHPQLRLPRNLPQVPGPRPQGEDPDFPNSYDDDERRLVPEGDEPYAPLPRRFVSDQYSEAGRRTTYGEGMPRPPSAARPGSEYPSQLQAPPPMPSRQTMWSQVLDPGRQPGVVPDGSNGRDTFVQIEAPAAAMTKAFTPHGLLSVGLQDKEDRSAKKQEELARETGASLINVPYKPPPPQTGLLGAITAHERERKREGGVGATLTEREREKRLAEDRQRKLDDLQRQQLEQMQQGGSVYGTPQLGGYNPMMMGMNPMMTGMNPMMTGFGMGYPGMMGGYGNPQHMFAAQQAAQAYQQAMMSFSQAGSQAGGEAGGGGGALNPMMTGGTMAGFDPRFSMMGMPMMSPMGMGGGMNPGMGGGLSPGMGGGMSPGMGPMGMQMTGGSMFDPRFSQFDPGAQLPMNDFAAQGRFTPRNGSGQNSPGGPRPLDSGEEAPRNSNNASPRPPQ